MLAILEQFGLPRNWIGYIFLLATVGLYAGIGIMSRTADVAEYYVAGRRVPALFNGMATGADWMSAASFIGMAGTLYLTGYDGLAFVMGWTGGYCLVALFLAPYLRKFGQFTIPDFLGARYGGHIPRFVGICRAILCSFTYVVAQIYGVGLITTRLTGVAFELGIFLGLGGILVCSFLGGMRAVTWTQVAQYIILIIAYMIPVDLAVGEAHRHSRSRSSSTASVLREGHRAREQLINDPKEHRGPRRSSSRPRRRGERQAEGAAGLVRRREGGKLAEAVEDLKAQNAPADQIARRADGAREVPEERRRGEGGMDQGGAVSRRAPDRRCGTPRRSRARTRRRGTSSRRNFLALVFCLMVGTAALPHILMRYYTTPSVKEARESVFWSLFFIFLLYFTAPALGGAGEVRRLHALVGSEFAKLPAWVAAWQKVDPTLLIDHRRQPGRHRAARGDRDRRRHRRAGDAGDRGAAVRDLGPGRGGRSRRGAVDRGRAAADDRQRAVARPLLQDDRPERVHADAA